MKTYISYQPNYGLVILIKVVILTPFYYPILGGITTFVENLRMNLIKKGCSVFIISNAGSSNKDIKVLKQSKYLFAIRSYQSIRVEKPDVLHSHSRWNGLAPCVIYKIFHPKTTLIHTYHTEPTDRIWKLKRKIIELLLSKSDFVTFVSKDLKQKIESVYNIKTQKTVIYSGVARKHLEESDVNRFSNKYSLGDEGPIISFIGPLVWKMKVEGVKKLIASFGIVRETYPKAKLLIIGDGRLRWELERIVKENNMQNDVIFTGSIANVFIPLSIIDIYTHISLQEGLPIVLLEAMSMGKPIIATKTGGIPEVIEHGYNGVLVEPEPKEIAQAIINLYNDKQSMETLGANALKTANERCDWDNVAQKFLDLYEQGR
jgi:glycosyltransferase involved in cell wall biosynthesis